MQAMTVGKDVAMLFPDMMNAMQVRVGREGANCVH